MVTAADSQQSESNEALPEGGAPPAAGPSFASQFSVESLLESLSEGVVVADSAGRIVLVNRRTEEIFGYRRAELVGQPLAVLLPSRFVASHSRMLDQFFAHPTLRHRDSGFDLVGLRRDGVEIPLEIGLNPLPGESGPMSLATIVDISRRRQAEEELKQRNEELDSFTHTLAHDLRGSLSLVKGFGELLLEELAEMEPKEIRRYVSIMMSNSEKMEAIIAGMMLLASTSRKDIPFATVKMAENLKAAMARLAAELDALEGELIVPENLPAVRGVAPWLEEVWVTLLGNAVRRGAQPARIEVGCQPMKDGAVTFWVKDNGAAISPADLKGMFAPSSATVLPKSASSGVSIKIVKRMIERMDGQVWAESADGAGTTFSFRLPGAVEPSSERA